MEIPRGIRNFYAGVIGLHHQGKSGDKVSRQGELWQDLQLEFEEKIRQIFCDGKLLLPDCPKEKKYVITPLLLKILILADWIASGENFRDAQDILAGENSMERIRKRGQRFFEDNGVEAAESPWAETFCEVWPNIPQDGRRPLQTETEALFHNTHEWVRLLLLEAPMGEGKTEAGMYAALRMQKQWGKNGFYVALPTSSTSNQMVGRMRKLMQMHGIEDTVRLLYSMAWLVDENTQEIDFNQKNDAQDIRRWLSPLRRGMLSPYAVGTVDQAMLAATKVRYGVLRMLGLANKVLVIDEIHSYDVYMDEIILRLLEWCAALEILVVMLSATLPADKKERLLSVYGGALPESAYPSITAVLESGKAVCRKVPPSGRRLEMALQLTPLLHDPAQITRLAVSQVENGGCLCVLMNMVAEAQQVYSAIKYYSGKILLFHAQFSAARREEIEKECLKLFGKDKSYRPEKAILVATQVVEQSLDVDFDGTITCGSTDGPAAAKAGTGLQT